MAEGPDAGPPSAFEEVSTLMIKGLPTGVTEREFRGYFMFADGFVKSMLHTWQQSVGYALFSSEKKAKYALDFLQGKIVGDSTLRVQWANRNLKERKKDPSEAGVPASQYVKFQKPSNTLYIGGIKGVSEQGLGDILLELRGFSKMKFIPPTDSTKDGSVCFAQFATTELATRGLGRLEGGLLPSCKKLVVDYSKNPLVSPPNWTDDTKPRNTMHIGPLPSSFCNSDVFPFLSKLEGYDIHRITQMQNKTVCFVRFLSIAACRAACGSDFPPEWGDCTAEFARKSLLVHETD